MVKNPPVSVGDTRDVGSIPGSGRSPGVGNSTPRPYSCLKIPMDRGAIHRLSESDTTYRLNNKNSAENKKVRV